MINCEKCNQNCCEREHLEVTLDELAIIKKHGYKPKTFWDFGKIISLETPCCCLTVGDKKCGIYEDRPLMCRIFPHCIQQFPNAKGLGLGINTSCPQWMRILTNDKEGEDLRKELVYLEAIMIARSQLLKWDDKSQDEYRKAVVKQAKAKGYPASMKLFYNFITWEKFMELQAALSMNPNYRGYFQ